MNLSNYPGLTQADLNWCQINNVEIIVVVKTTHVEYRGIMHDGKNGVIHETGLRETPRLALWEICINSGLVSPWVAQKINHDNPA